MHLKIQPPTSTTLIHSPPLCPDEPTTSLDVTTDDHPPASKRPALGHSAHCNDVAQFINTHSNITSADKFNLLTHHF